MADNDFIVSPNTGASLLASDANSERKLWKKTVDISESEEDFYQQLEGNRPDSLIETVTDTAAGKGQSITFSVTNGFYQEGKHGDENFEEPADFEKIVVKSNQLSVDFVRHAVRYNERMEERMGLRYELVNKIPAEQGKWMGRKKCRATEMKWIRKAKANSHNFACAGGGSSVDELGGANVLGWDDFVDVNAILVSHGAAPAMLGKIGKNRIKRYVTIAPHIGLRSLKKDENYLAAQRDAGERGESNKLFTGGFEDIDGTMILSREILDHDGDGPLGAALAPKLRLSAAVTAGTTTFDVTGGTNTKVLYTVDFPNHAFKYNASDAEATATDPFYLLVVNPPNAPTDPGKMGFYKCVGNTGKAITITERLAAAVSGIANTTVGSVVWNTAKWLNKTTDVHPAGAMAYLANAKGQPIGYSIFTGACGMRRGYGKYRNARATDSKEGKFINESYIVSVFGMQPKINLREEFPNFMVLCHSLAYPGTPIPTDL